ncbi:MAG: hypothetical protein IJ234_08515 [Clostridia bacterium]|nr:hypothetical protein [Clostridia bacterium]
MSAMTRLRKTQFIPFLDVSGTGGASPAWKRIDLSTIFELDAGVQTETMDYISYETPVTEIIGYAPRLPQEIALYQGNAVYDFVSELFYRLPVGAEAKVPALICFGGSERRAWRVDDCVLELGALNAVEGRIRFTLRLGGDIVRGTYALSNGAPAFQAE